MKAKIKKRETNKKINKTKAERKTKENQGK